MISKHESDGRYDKGCCSAVDPPMSHAIILNTQDLLKQFIFVRTLHQILLEIGTG